MEQKIRAACKCGESIGNRAGNYIIRICRMICNGIVAFWFITLIVHIFTAKEIDVSGLTCDYYRMIGNMLSVIYQHCRNGFCIGIRNCWVMTKRLFGVPLPEWFTFNPFNVMNTMLIELHHELSAFITAYLPIFAEFI